MKRKKISIPCKQCGTEVERFFHAPLPAAGTFCSPECRVKSKGERPRNKKNQRPLRSCVYCEKPNKRKWSNHCSKTCLKNDRMKAKTRMCLCCGKTWSGNRILQKKPKGTASKMLHNAFCSRGCAWKYKGDQADRKARCGKCGKATGKSDVTNCMACKRPPRNTWDGRLFEWASKESRHIPKSWDEKLNAMKRNNLHREAVATVREEKSTAANFKRRRKTAWVDRWNEACSEMILAFDKDRENDRRTDEWARTIHSWVANSRKRILIKQEKLRLRACGQS